MEIGKRHNNWIERFALKKYHPDLHPNDEDANANMQALNVAYAILKHTQKRANYDEQLRSQAEEQSNSKKVVMAKPYFNWQMAANFLLFIGLVSLLVSSNNSKS